MILCTSNSSPISGQPTQKAWPAFEASQQHPASGCITQPAHAMLAGEIAAALHPGLFGPLPPEVIDTVARHDAGWSGPDLAALEHAAAHAPESFLSVPPRKAVLAWRESIRSAERRSPLAGVLTSRHFTLLDPHDGDPAHDHFRTEETAHCQPAEAALTNPAATERQAPVSPADLDRYTAALGFCDLLSLCLCSGILATITLPLAHPADPAGAHAPEVEITLAQTSLSSTHPVLQPGITLSTTAWRFDGNSLRSTHRAWQTT